MHLIISAVEHSRPTSLVDRRWIVGEQGALVAHAYCALATDQRTIVLRYIEGCSLATLRGNASYGRNAFLTITSEC